MRLRQLLSTRQIMRLYRFLRTKWFFRLSVLLLAVGLGLSLLALHGFIEVTEEIFEPETAGQEQQVSRFIQQYRSERLTPLMLVFTTLGDRPAFLVLCALLMALVYWLRKSWVSSLEIGFVLLTAGLLNIGLKQYFSRPRPVGDHLVEVSTLSYPSGHAMSSMAFYGFLIYLVWRVVPSLALRICCTVLLSLLILVIGISRVYLGVHYPTDVLAGYAAGMFWLLLCITLFNAIRLLHRHYHRTHLGSGTHQLRG